MRLQPHNLLHDPVTALDSPHQYQQIERQRADIRPHRRDGRGSGRHRGRAGENHNGLIRRFLPKGKRIDSYDEDAILGVELWANGLPRKILGYRTPDEAFEAEMDRIFAV